MPDTSGERIRVFTIANNILPILMADVWFTPSAEPMVNIMPSKPNAK